MNLQWYPFDVQSCSFVIFAGNFFLEKQYSSYISRKKNECLKLFYSTDDKIESTKLEIEQNSSSTELATSTWKISLKPGHEVHYISDTEDNGKSQMSKYNQESLQDKIIPNKFRPFDFIG